MGSLNLEGVRLVELITLARARAASDLHAAAAEVPVLRIDGRLTALDVPPLDAAALEAFANATLSDRQRHRRSASGSVDVTCRTGAGAPYRLHAYSTMTGLRLAFRFLSSEIPDLEELGLPAALSTFATRGNGLVIFTGPTGSGKTTALAAVIDRLNRTAERLIVTIEDPVEYLHRPIRSVIAHCNAGADTPDCASAVYGFMRADPDVILIGELRDRATMEAALSAAETGHLVLTTLHTNDAAQTIDRIIDSFPSDAQSQVRSQLASTLLGVVALRLVPRREGNGRIAASEILVGTDAVRAMIRDGKTHQLRNAVATGRSAGMRTLETSLSELVVRGAVTIEAARAAATRPADVRDFERSAG